MKRSVSFLIILILFFASSALVKNIWDSHKKINDLNEIREKEKALFEKNKELEKELEDRKSKKFVEEEARNKLGLSKPGETIFVVGIESKELAGKSERVDENLNNWQHWVEIFSE